MSLTFKAIPSWNSHKQKSMTPISSDSCSLYRRPVLYRHAMHWLPISHRINFKLYKYIQHPNRHIFFKASMIACQFTGSYILQCHYAPHNDICCMCSWLELHTAAALYRTYGINFPPMFCWCSRCDQSALFRSRLKTRLFTAAFGDK